MSLRTGTGKYNIMLGMACVLYPEGRPIINKREINIKKQRSAAWQSSVIFEGLMECSWLRERKRTSKKGEGEYEGKGNKWGENKHHNGKEGGYNNKTRKSTWIPLLIRSKSHRKNSDSCDTLMYKAPSFINLQHPVTLIYLLVLCYSRMGMLFFISSVCLLVWQLCASAPIHSTRLLSCHCHAAPSVQTADLRFHIQMHYAHTY